MGREIISMNSTLDCSADFFLAMLLILLFSVKLGWFPIVGPESLEILVLLTS
jgi:ABC-type dipeptide/oligopeptide/nickel transport system permease component